MKRAPREGAVERSEPLGARGVKLRSVDVSPRLDVVGGTTRYTGTPPASEPPGVDCSRATTTYAKSVVLRNVLPRNNGFDRASRGR